MHGVSKRSSRRNGNIRPSTAERKQAVAARLRQFMVDFMSETDRMPNSYQFQTAHQWKLYLQLTRTFGSLQVAAEVQNDDLKFELKNYCAVIL